MSGALNVSHVFVGVRDFDRALAFYQPLMKLLGIIERFCDHSRPWAGWQLAGQALPLFLAGVPLDGEHDAGNGQMKAFMAPSRAALPCPYYGAYFRDPDGNKLGVVCHDAPALITQD